eukprot:3189966-Lingulodinium_polyedra.AAC.1
MKFKVAKCIVALPAPVGVCIVVGRGFSRLCCYAHNVRIATPRSPPAGFVFCLCVTRVLHSCSYARRLRVAPPVRALSLFPPGMCIAGEVGTAGHVHVPSNYTARINQGL